LSVPGNPHQGHEKKTQSKLSLFQKSSEDHQDQRITGA
jgi:hypothetical protein